MADLQKTDPKLNVYFQNKRIRRHLLKAGLINRHGDILPPTSDEPVHTKKKISKTVDKHVPKEEQKRQTVLRSQFDLSTKHTRVEKNKESKKPRRVVSPSLLTLRSLSTSANKKRSPTRAKSAHNLSHEPKKHSVSNSAKAKSPTRDCCRVEMIYYAPQTNIDHDSNWLQPDGDEIVVMQQHCGGENLTVFKGHVKPNDKFSFDSRRHADYPFALSLHINGLFHSRISVCCEYKHKRNVPLGGKHGLFGITHVSKMKLCRSCRDKRRRKKSKSTASIALEPSRYQKSVVPRLSSRSRSHSPPVRRTPTPPRTLLTTKCPSPDISRTPTPPRKEDQKKSSILSANRNLPTVPTDRNSTTQSASGSRTNNDENYSSDFDETDDDDLPPTTTRFDRPRISDSHSIGNQEDSDNISRPSSSVARKSLLPENKDHNHASQILTRRNNAIDRSLSSSSDTSRKSDPSPKFEIKRQLNENNTRFPSNSNDYNLTKSSAKNSTDIPYSSNVHRTWTTAEDDFFGN